MSNSEELRELERAILNQPANVWDEKKKKYIQVTMLDISLSGTRLDMRESSHSVGDEIKLYWVPVPGLPPLLFEGTVVWREKEAAGIKFSALSKKQEFILQSFVKIHREHFKNGPSST